MPVSQLLLPGLNIIHVFRVCAAQTGQLEISKTSVTGKSLYTNSLPVRDFYLFESCFILMDFSAQGCKDWECEFTDCQQWTCLPGHSF